MASSTVPTVTIKVATSQARMIAAELEEHINYLRTKAGGTEDGGYDNPRVVMDPIVQMRIEAVREFIDSELKQ